MIMKRLHFIRKKFNMRSKILFSLISMTIIPFILFAVLLYVIMYGKITSENQVIMNDELAKCNGAINAQLTLYVRRSLNTSMNGMVLSGVRAYIKWDFDKIIDFKTLMNNLTNDFDSSANAEPFMFYLEDYKGVDSKYVANMDVLGDKRLVDSVLKASTGKVVWRPDFKIDNSGAKNIKYVSFYRNLTESIGYSCIMELNIPFNTIKVYMDNINMHKQERVVFRNSYGNVLYQNWKESKTGTFKLDDTDSFFSASRKLPFNAGDVTILLPKNIINREYVSVLLLIVLAFLLIMTFVIITSVITSKKITQNLTDFISYIKNHDDLILNDEISRLEDSAEISIIKLKFLKQIKEKDETYQNLINTKNQNNMLETELLQARINPHLLYNSLSVIKWSALRQGDKNSVKIVDAMTHYYRIALSKGNNIVEIMTELNMVREYMNIVNYTHSYKYELEINVDEEILKYITLKHLLQPVVENAVLHGLNEKGNGGKVTIDGYMKDGDLIFRIEDNGYGMDENMVKDILNPDYETSYGGYGIRNLIKRIHIYYGDSYGIDIESALGTGTVVTIKIKAMYPV
jgi:two-component system sensor histidine kinase YesM